MLNLVLYLTIVELASGLNILKANRTVFQIPKRNMSETVYSVQSKLNDTSNRNKREPTSSCYSNPCNSGTCYDLQVNILPSGGFYCVCPNGYTGTQCEKEINECLSAPCKNNGKCLDLIDSFFCQCPKGFSGITCDNKMQSQICPPNACGDGECVLTTHPTFQYACKCRDGSYKFEPCSSAIQSKCAAQPCAPYPCVETPNAPSGYVCQCGMNDYRTTSCDSSECKFDSCSNGGTCIPYNANEPWCNPSQTGKTCCQCKAGFNGLKCETDINECQSNPCQNGAECLNLVNSYKCKCRAGFLGQSCEKRAGCAVNPCKSGGTCILDKKNAEVCQCRDGFTGTFCEIDINECASSPCQNGGTCIDLENSYACYCPDGYFRPSHCPLQQANLSPEAVSTTSPTLQATTEISLMNRFCENNPCFNDGVCTENGCICANGYSGNNCETLSVSGSYECNRLQCLNGATCNDDGSVSSRPYCSCRPGFTGSRCETEYFRCTQNGIFNDPYGCAQGRYLECIHYGQSQAGFPTGILYRRDCPAGLRFNSDSSVCDYADNVQC